MVSFLRLSDGPSGLATDVIASLGGALSGWEWCSTTDWCGSDHDADCQRSRGPIAEYGFLSDCEDSCLIAPDGSVEWLCLPRPDSPSVFGALLDRSAGSFRFWSVEHPCAPSTQVCAGNHGARDFDKGVNKRGRFRQHFANDELDASLLLIPILGFLPTLTPTIDCPSAFAASLTRWRYDAGWPWVASKAP